VKQLHFFGNVAQHDMTSLAALRQQAQPLMNLRIYSFLKTIISRWPLDTSFLNVLELWLSYIQPWRYIYNRNIQNLNSEVQEIPERFKTFISENLIIYTQIFVRLIPRFMKMDLSLNKNAFMLFRLMKVFRQPSEILRELERHMNNNTSNNVMRSHNSSFNDSIHSSPPRTPNTSFNRTTRHNQSAIEDSNYIFMFSNEVTEQIYILMQRLYLAKLKTHSEVVKMEKEMQKHATAWEKFLQFIGWFSSLSLSFTMALEEKKKTPVYLDFCLNILSPVFDIRIEDATREFEQSEIEEENFDENGNGNLTVNSDYLNITPSFMKSQIFNISYTGDPFLLPISQSEVRFLVRFLYQVSVKVNEMVS
jgi:sphingomyelin phosphodiesterase 4